MKSIVVIMIFVFLFMFFLSYRSFILLCVACFSFFSFPSHIPKTYTKINLFVLFVLASHLKTMFLCLFFSLFYSFFRCFVRGFIAHCIHSTSFGISFKKQKKIIFQGTSQLFFSSHTKINPNGIFIRVVSSSHRRAHSKID